MTPENYSRESDSNARLRILTVFGTRPEAIKLAPVVVELRRRAGVVLKVCVTGQHREMLDQVLGLFGLVPDHDLNLMQEKQRLTALAASIVERLDPVLDLEQPDWVIVQGDTTTTAAAALAAFYHRCKVAHVEAGLRSYDKWQPFPEEVNRRVTSVVADLHFAPTEHSRQNLLLEGIPDSQILVTGNTIIDALHWIQAQPYDLGSIGNGSGHWLGPNGTKLILVTAHRRENFGEPIRRICCALRTLAERYGEAIHLVYPVHRNPNIWEPVHELLGDIQNISLIPPLDYLALVHLMKRSYLAITDSGGIQEEAPALGVPALVLREVTERPEGVETGNVRLVGSDPERIVKEASLLLEDSREYARMAHAANPYGDGCAALRIADALEGGEH